MQLNSSRISLIALGTLATVGGLYGLKNRPAQLTQDDPKSLEAQRMAQRLGALQQSPQAGKPEADTDKLGDRSLGKSSALAQTSSLPTPLPPPSLSSASLTESAELSDPVAPSVSSGPAFRAMDQPGTGIIPARMPQASTATVDALVDAAVSSSLGQTSSRAPRANVRQAPTQPTEIPLPPVLESAAVHASENLGSINLNAEASLDEAASVEQTMAAMPQLSGPQETMTPSLTDTTPLLQVPTPAPLEPAGPASLSALPEGMSQQISELSQTLPAESNSPLPEVLKNAIGSDTTAPPAQPLEQSVTSSKERLGQDSIIDLNATPIVVSPPEMLAEPKTAKPAALAQPLADLDLEVKLLSAVAPKVQTPKVPAPKVQAPKVAPSNPLLEPSQTQSDVPASLWAVAQAETIAPEPFNFLSQPKTQGPLESQVKQLYASRQVTSDVIPVDSFGRKPEPAVSAAAPSGAQVSRMLEPGSYTLGPGDRIKVDIYNVPEYSKDYQVLANGVVNLFRVGALPVYGKTITQVEGEIARRYQRLIKNPLVDMTLVSARPLNVSVAGEVGKPGAYTLPIDNGVMFPTITKLIQQAGGMTQAANAREIMVRRPLIGGDRMFKVNLVELFQTGNLLQDMPLRDGDMVVIPPQTQVDLAQAAQIVSANFAVDISQPLNIAVVGEVNRPGPLVLSAAAQLGKPGGGRPTISQALKEAGSITQTADIREIEVRRMTRMGSTQRIRVNLWELLKNGDLNQDLVLQQGDTVMVPKATTIAAAEAAQLAIASFSPEAMKINVIGEVEKPGAVEVVTNSTLNQTILATGGFSKRANKKVVMLIRPNPDGTVTKREIKIDLARGIDEAINPILQKNDIVIVKPSGGAKFSDTLEKILDPIGRLLPFKGILR